MVEKKSRQREYQQRNHEQGLCSDCPEPAVTKWHCEKHRRLRNAQCRKYRFKGRELRELREYRCSMCYVIGHNARTCPKRAIT